MSMTRASFDTGIAILESLFCNLKADKLMIYWETFREQRDDVFIRACRRLGTTFSPKHREHFPEQKLIFEAIEDERTSFQTKGRYEGPPTPKGLPCPYCADMGFVLFRGRWEPEGGWSADFVRSCWCAAGQIVARNWSATNPRDKLGEARLEELQENDREYRASRAAWIAAMPEDRKLENLTFARKPVGEIIHMIAAGVAEKDLAREKKLSGATEYDPPEDGEPIPF
jgi:hypothetical protein